MIHTTENVSHAQTAPKLWQDRDSPQEMIYPTVQNVLHNSSAKDALPALNQLQEKVVLEIPNSLLLKNLPGIMSASFVACAKNQWLAKDSFKMKTWA